MKRLTFGKFVKRDSLLHGLHPLLKFIMILSIILIIGFNGSTALLGFYFILFCVLFLCSNLKIREVAAVMKPFRYLLILTFCFQYLSVGSDLFSLNIEIASLAASYTFRFGLLILFSALFTLTTSPIDIVRVLHHLLRPLGIFGMDVKRFSLSALVALRFIPILFRESRRILEKLKTDGQMPAKGFGVIKRIDLFLNPLFGSIFHYADRVGVFLARQHNWQRILILEKVSLRDVTLFMAAMVVVSGGFFV